MELTQEQKAALKGFLFEALEGSSDMVNAVYISPAQSLRNQANRLEQRQRDYPFLREILAILQETGHTQEKV